MHGNICAACRDLNVGHNNLVGSMPSSLSIRFPDNSFDYNCFDNCIYLRQPWCPFPISNATMQALAELFHATGGAGWVNSAGWDPLPTNPCDGSVFGVDCGHDRTSCAANVTLVDPTALHVAVQCVASVSAVCSWCAGCCPWNRTTWLGQFLRPSWLCCPTRRTLASLATS